MSNPASSSPNPNDNQEFLEIKSVSLEWKLSNLKHIFDTSKGDTKSKCVKSAFFGQGKWQVFFYPNSGHDQYCSLYLSCQPTPEEFEKAAVYQLTKHSLLPSSASSSTLSRWSHSLSISYQTNHTDCPHFDCPFNDHPANSAHLKPLDPSQVPWQREGLFKFTFEIKSLDRRTTYKTMEANDHAFSHEARNWGWAQYWRRNDAYYSNPSYLSTPSSQAVAKAGKLIGPTPPAPQPTTQMIKKLMPLDLLEAYSSLFNDPLYSDICFKIIRRRRHRDGIADKKSCSNVVVRRLYASKKVLIRRSEYFSTMFESGFAESTVTLSNDSSDDPNHSRDMNNSDWLAAGEHCDDDDDDDLMEEDSDDCDDDENVRNEEYEEEEMLQENMLKDQELQPYEAGTEPAKRDTADHELIRLQDNDTNHDKLLQSDSSADRSLNILTSDGMAEQINYGTIADNSAEVVPESPPAHLIPLDPRNSHLPSPNLVPLCAASPGLKITHQPNSNHPSQDNRVTPKGANHNCCTDLSPTTRAIKQATPAGPSKQTRKPTNLRSAKKMTVIKVTDAAYTTFKALLYFLYTDSISFAPLSSTYCCLKDEALETGVPFCYHSRKAYGNAVIAKAAFICSGGQSVPSRSAVDSSLVCSAKAIYRLADKLNLTELKSRAFEHITRSLTVQNIPMEVFSSFTSAYEEIRKIEVNYMLTHWNEVRDGRSMKTVLKMLSEGGKVCSGFSEIWSVLLSNLEFKPKLIDNTLSLGGPQQGNHLQHHQNDSTQDAVVPAASGSAAGGIGASSQSREAVELLWTPVDRVPQGSGGGASN